MLARNHVTLAIALGLGALPRTAATQGLPFDEPWRQVRYTTAEHLPSEEVTHLAEAMDGTLWASTTRGLAWFDGWTWHPIPVDTAGPPQRAAQQLTRGPGTSMLAVIHNLLFRGDLSGFRKLPIVLSGKEGLVLGAVTTDDGILVLARAHSDSAAELVLLRDGRQEPLQRPAMIGRRLVPALFPGAANGAWLNTETGIWRWNGSTWTLRFPAHGQPFTVATLAEKPDGRGGVVSFRNPLPLAGTWAWTGDGPLRHQASEGDAAALDVTFRGSLSVAVSHGGHLRWTDGDTWHSFDPEHVAYGDAAAVYFDRLGDLWIAGGGGLGLVRAGSELWRVHRHGFPNRRDRVNTIAIMPDGALWSGTGDGLDILEADGRDRHVASILGTPLGAVTGLARDSTGNMWVTSGGSFDGAFRWDGKAWRHFGPADGLDADRIHAVTVDRQGRVWFLGLTRRGAADGPGAIVLEGGRFTRWGPSEGMPSGRVYAFAEGPDGAKWFGTMGGLSRWKDGAWTHWTKRRGVAAGGRSFTMDFRVFSLALDPSGRPWFGGGEPADYAYGLGTVDERDSLQFQTTQEGLPHNVVWGVLAAPDGTIWTATDRGIAAYRDGVWFRFGTDRGLPHAAAWPMVLRGDTLTVGTLGDGVRWLRLDEARLPPPHVLVDEAVVEGRRAVVRWSAFAHRGSVAPALVETRARLDSGMWSPWSTTGAATFEDLRPGQHTVSIQAKGLFAPIEPVSAKAAIRVDLPVLLRPLVAVPLALLTSALVLVAVVGVRRRLENERERAAAQEALRASEERFATAFRASPEPIAIITYPEGVIVEVNAGFEAMTGWSRAECVGRTSADLGVYDNLADRDRLLDELARHGHIRNAEFVLRARDGSRRTMLISTEIIAIGGRRHMVSVMTDTTERRALQAQLVHAQKMEAVGQLAGGVAHDFNNLLTAILGHAELLRDQVHHDAQGDVDEIHRAATRAADLTSQLLMFARKRRSEPRVMNLNELVGRTDRLLRRLLGERIAMATQCLHDLPSVRVDPGQFEQVLVNLAVNARDAMPDGGKLTVETAAMEVSEAEAREYPDATPGHFVVLSVSDSGVGIVPELRNRIFEPFFTTKDVGKGTGLGLAICYGIVREAGGFITLESEVGRGTTFRVFVPAVEDPLSRNSASRPGAMPTGHETVLLVEDEPAVRTLVRRILEDAGYSVMAAEDGAAALGLLDGASALPDILLSDVMLPGLTGPEIARRVRERVPGIVVLYISGYTERAAGAAADIDGALLQKPFTPLQLTRRIREVLDDARTGAEA